MREALLNAIIQILSKTDKVKTHPKKMTRVFGRH